MDEGARIVFSVGNAPEDNLVLESLSLFNPEETGDLFIDGDFAGEKRVGVGFFIPSMGLKVYITELRSSYYGDSDLLRLNYILMILFTVIVSALFVILFIRHSLKPLRYVIADMNGIVKNRDFRKRVDPVQNDEVGELAREFNLMSDYLDRVTTRLRDTARQEAEQRIEVRNRGTGNSRSPGQGFRP